MSASAQPAVVEPAFRVARSDDAGEVLQMVADRLESRIDDLSLLIVERFRNELPDYARAGSLGTAEEIRESVRGLTMLFSRVIREQRRLSLTELSTISKLGTVRAQQGIALQSVLSGVRVAMRVGWWDTVDWIKRKPLTVELFEVMADLGLQLVTYIDDISVAVTDSYTRHQERQLSEQERRRQAFLEDLMMGTGEKVRSRGLEMGFDVNAPWIMLMASTAIPEQQPSAARHAAEEIRRTLGGPVDVCLLGGAMAHLVIMVRAPREVHRREGEDALRLAVQSQGITAICSPACKGPAEINSTYLRMRELLPLAVTACPRGSLVSVSEMSLYAVLGSSSEEERAIFIEQTLGCMLDQPTCSRDALLKTLEALHDHRGSIRGAAQALNVHPKTIQYRGSRIAELTGLSLHVPAERMRLDLALYLIRLSGQAAKGGGAPDA